MISNDRSKYRSATEWLSALRQDEVWLLQLEQLKKMSTADVNAYRDEALRRIGNGETFEFWGIYQHQVEPVVAELWEISGLSLPKLKIQVIGMLSMEWIEQQTTTNEAILSSDTAKKYWKRLEEAGFVDAKGTLLDATTRKQTMYIAEHFAERLGIVSKWKTFEQFWGTSHLAQEKWEMLENGKLPTRSKEIEKIFED